MNFVDDTKRVEMRQPSYANSLGEEPLGKNPRPLTDHEIETLRQRLSGSCFQIEFPDTKDVDIIPEIEANGDNVGAQQGQTVSISQPLGNTAMLGEQRFSSNSFSESVKKAFSSGSIPSLRSVGGSSSREEEEEDFICHCVKDYGVEDCDNQVLKLGSYISKGSFGKVYGAMLGSLPVAVKIVSVTCEVEMEKVSQEVDLILGMRHPNIVSAYRCMAHRVKKQSREKYDWIIDDGDEPQEEEVAFEVWIVQELCTLGTLHDAIRSGLFLDDDINRRMERIVRISIDVAKGLEYMHSEDIIHGDLSSSNVLLTRAKCSTNDACTDQECNIVAKVNDFGRSRFQSAKSIITNSIGTVTHM